MTQVRVALPAHLRSLARLDGEALLEVAAPPTIDVILGSLEARYPALRGTIRDAATGKRRAFMRFFACGQDFSHEPTDTLLPSPVASGEEPLCVVGAIAGG